MMPELSKNLLIKTSVIFLVFILFLSGAIGLVEISPGQAVSIGSQFNNLSELFQFAVNKVFYTRDFIFLFISGLVLTIALPLLSPIKGIVLTLFLLLLAIGIGFFNNTGLIPIEYCLLTIIVIYMIHILMSYFIELQSRQKLIETFGHYIPPHLVNELSRSAKELSLEGEARTLTVFFCDLQNFTSISEELNLKQLNLMLNEYFTIMTELLLKYNSTI